jgi:hypothetical protein
MMFPLHAAPHDYFRYTRHGFEAMCARHGLEIVEEYELAGFWYMASVFSERYFSVFSRSIVRRLRVVEITTFPLRWLFRLLHAAEGGAYSLLGKNVADSRRSWTVNYVYVARRANLAGDGS